jgi:sec-independent protein translocase protein TatB
MLASMFGMGGSEILLILIIALLCLGPDKLPDAATKISKGIRDLKRHGRVLQRTIEDDEHIGGAIKDLKSALRGDEIRNLRNTIMAGAEAPPPKKKRKKKVGIAGHAAIADAAGAALATPAAADPPAAADGEPVAIPASPAAPTTTAEVVAELDSPAPAKPAITLPMTAGERDDEDEAATCAADAEAEAAELAAMIRPAAGTVPKTSPTADAAPASSEPTPERKHG